MFGLLNVTRAALPVMRTARGGRIFNLSSVAGMRGSEMGSLYCATKWAVEGFSEALALELAPFGITVTIIEPGPFRTDFLTPGSIRFGAKAIPDYEERRTAQRATFEQRNGKQPGDPVKLAEAMVQLANDTAPPMRFAAGAMAVTLWDAKLGTLHAELDQWRALGTRDRLSGRRVSHERGQARGRPLHERASTLRSASNWRMNVGQDAAVRVVVHLDRRVDAQDQRHALALAVGAVDPWVASPCGVIGGGPVDVDGLVAGDTQAGPGHAGLELQRQHAHAHQVVAVDALEAACDDGLDAQQVGALGRPVAARAGAVLLAGEDDRGRALGLVGHRGIVDRHRRRSCRPARRAVPFVALVQRRSRLPRGRRPRAPAASGS